MRTLDIGDIVGGRQLVSICIGPDLQPILLSLEGRADYRLMNKLGASFPKLFSSRTNRFRVRHLIDGQWATTNLPQTHENYHIVQPLPHGRWLTVRGRAKSESDYNAHVFEADGRPVASFHAGDGIEDCQAMTDGKIWCSYFDEGIYGDVPTGRSGLVSFDAQGDKLGDYAEIGEQIGDISDCYALNVASTEDVWLCYYTDFPLVHLRQGQLQDCWRENPVSGSHAFAVADGHVIFAGSYDHRELLIKVRLKDMEVETRNVVDEKGKSVLGYHAIGRGGKLFLQTKASLYEVDVTCC
jgi:hypothetical protein